jgi:hypothetical protein
MSNYAPEVENLVKVYEPRGWAAWRGTGKSVRAVDGASLANPVTWQVDFLRYCTLGTGAPHRIAWEALAFIVFSLVTFLFAARALQQQ